MKPTTWSAIALAVAAAAWFSWMFRYVHMGQALFLDRWTGDVVSTFDGERFALHAPPAAPRELSDAEVFGNNANDPFADLLPPPQGFARERKK